MATIVGILLSWQLLLAAVWTVRALVLYLTVNPFV